jgi:hypothetical protein
VLKVHTVEGDVGSGSGNIRFPGTVRILGSEQSGFRVVGEGKAVLRARKSLRRSSSGGCVPGGGAESHGRQREIKTPLREVVFYFNTTTGRIAEKPMVE